MCAGKDEVKRHLHYPSNCRSLVSKMSRLMGIQEADILSVAVSAGIGGMLLSIAGEIDPKTLDHKTREQYRSLVRESERQTAEYKGLYEAMADQAIENLINAEDLPF